MLMGNLNRRMASRLTIIITKIATAHNLEILLGRLVESLRAINKDNVLMSAADNG